MKRNSNVPFVKHPIQKRENCELMLRLSICQQNKPIKIEDNTPLLKDGKIDSNKLANYYVTFDNPKNIQDKCVKCISLTTV